MGDVEKRESLSIVGEKSIAQPNSRDDPQESESNAAR